MKGVVILNQSQRYAIHLDNLRRKNNITVENLCNNIVDPRNYRRYINGERTLTNSKIEEFCNCFKISITDFYYSASEQDKYEFALVNDLYKLIQNKNYLQFYKDAKLIKISRFIDVQNKRFYKFCFIKVEFQTKKASPKDLLIRLYEMANYPKCLKKKAYDFVDLVSLQLIAELETEFGETNALERLIQILEYGDMIYLSSDSSTVIPSIYANVSLFLTRLKRFEDSDCIASAGVDYSIRYSNNSALSHLYAIKAQSAKELMQHSEAELNAIKSFFSVIVRDSQYEIDMIYTFLVDKLNINPIELIKKYENRLLKIDDKIN